MSYKKILFLSLILSISLLNAQGSLLLVGGGGENYNKWSDLPYSWFVEQADSGKIINIDTDEASGWYPDYFKSFGASSESKNIQIATEFAAKDSSIYRELSSARGIFMEGGNQWEYVNTWQGTLVEAAIHEVFNNGGVIGGTSAGLAVLGEICFDARNGSAYPEETAKNAWDPKISLTDDFLEILPDVLTDSHFHPRGRLGRLVPMMAQRISYHHDRELMGIGVDDKTALCIAPDMKAKCYGKGSVTILYQSDDSEIISENKQPVKFTNLNFEQLVHGMEYDLAKKAPINPEKYLQPVDYTPQTRDYQDITINGSDAESSQLGEIEIKGLTSNDLNAWYGDLSIAAGERMVPGAVIIPRLWYDDNYNTGPNFFENRIIGGIYGVAKNPGFQAIYLDTGCTAQVSSDGILEINGYGIILDTRDMQYVGFPQKLQEDAPIRNSNHPGMIGAKIHFLRQGDRYDLQNHKTSIESENGNQPEDFKLYNCYPNPFNPETKITYSLPESGLVNLEIYNLIGKKVATLVNEEQNASIHNYSWDGSDKSGNRLSSGVYFLRLDANINGDQYTASRKVLLVK
jgi:cyanophycinase